MESDPIKNTRLRIPLGQPERCTFHLRRNVPRPLGCQGQKRLLSAGRARACYGAKKNAIPYCDGTRFDRATKKTIHFERMPWYERSYELGDWFVMRSVSTIERIASDPVLVEGGHLGLSFPPLFSMEYPCKENNVQPHRIASLVQPITRSIDQSIIHLASGRSALARIVVATSATAGTGRFDWSGLAVTVTATGQTIRRQIVQVGHTGHRPFAQCV
jgi:hypothetical protein